MTYFNQQKVKTLGDNKIMGLGEIIRYNNRPKIKNENVAEHSFYVVTTVIKICNLYNIGDMIRLKALEFAAVHDIAELLIGDIPYDTKVNNPELRAAVEQAEVTALENHMPEYLDAYKKFLEEEKEETVAYLITKLADTVSVLQYSNRELDLGNKTLQMREINEGAQERVFRLVQKLEDKLELPTEEF